MGNGHVSGKAQLASFKNAIADRYLIDSEIGRGGMAIVYAAREVRLGRGVALKVLAPAVASASTVAAFLREISHTVQLEHPNILPVFDAGEAEGLCFYAMRYVRSGSLRGRLLRYGRLSLPETVSIVRQTAAALQHAHDRQVLHCDVKPENILLDGDHVYLADFGISRAVRRETFAWEQAPDLERGCGTASYVSPEQAFGEPSLDGRADVYSLACVAYEMLVGQPPFAGSNGRSVVASQFTDRTLALDAMRTTVPEPAARAIARALAMDAAERHWAVSEFADALARSLSRNGNGRRRSGGSSRGGIVRLLRRAR